MKTRLEEVTKKLGFTLTENLKNLLSNYDNKNRFYHNSDHIMNMICYVANQYKIWPTLISEENLILLSISILFHDIIYDINKHDNELQSYLVCEQICKEQNIYVDGLPTIKSMIMATKDHNYNANEEYYIKWIILADLNGFAENFESIWKDNINISKEYQKYDWDIFKEKRIEFLTNLNSKINNFMPTIAYYNIEKLITVMQVYTPNIAIYSGSFNPFHKGHKNILEKAEQIFDKVIIARGKNLDKQNDIWDLPEYLKFRQIDNFDGLLTDYINTKNYSVTIVKGLRNTDDFNYELMQYRYLQDLNKNIKVVNLFCDKEFDHISSRAIRSLNNYKDFQNLYL